jgi:hypothetical protein
MADNLGYTPGTGAKVATRDATYSGEAANLQIVGLATVAGADDAKTITDVSGAAPLPVMPLGELVEALEAQRMALQALTRTIGQSMPDVSGRLRVAIDAISASLTLSTVSTVTTVSTVSSVTTLANQTNMGGFSATEQIPVLMRLGIGSLRSNISVT